MARFYRPAVEGATAEPQTSVVDAGGNYQKAEPCGSGSENMKKIFIGGVFWGLVLSCGLSPASESSSRVDKDPVPAGSGSPLKKPSTQRPQTLVPAIDVQCGNHLIEMQPAASAGSESPKKSEKAPDEKSFDWNALIHDVAWPLTLLLVLLIFRRRIPLLVHSFLRRIKKIKHNETELEFLSKEANESLASAAGGDGRTLNIDAVFETVKLNEWATLIMARMLMRKGVVEFVDPNHEFGPSPSLQTLLEHASAKNLLPADLIGELERLREITYFAEWWRGRRPSKGDWKWAVANCKRVIQSLFDLHPIV